jgi:predicted metal-dependent hydrolase
MRRGANPRLEAVKDRVSWWADRLGVQPRVVRIQRMTKKWGSCSTAGTITLADDLVAQSQGFQDYVIVHELLHLKVAAHGRLFHALLSAHLPDWRVFDAQRRGRAC